MDPHIPDPRIPRIGYDVAKLIRTAPHFSIASTGRAGSQHISYTLRKLKIICGHENWWTPKQARIRFGMDGDSSWMVVPLLDRYQGTTLLQVRHPLKVINSYVGLQDGAFMRGDLPDDVYWRLHVATLPRLTFRRDPIANAADWWWEINMHALDYSAFWWRLEDLNGNPELLQRIAKHAGWPASLEDCEAALDTPPSNRHPGRTAHITWEDIPQPLRSKVKEVAEVFGYDV